MVGHEGAATLLAAVALVIGSAPAQAAGTDPCPGAVIEPQPIGEMGKEVGKLVVHYSPERNGTNCAATVAIVETNEPRLMTVHLARCKFSFWIAGGKVSPSASGKAVRRSHLDGFRGRGPAAIWRRP